MAVFGNSRPQFTDKNGDPISGGKLYIGLPNQDPVANPAAITDLNDVPISSPVTLDENGVPDQAIKLEAEFSQAVFDRNNVEVTSYQIARTSGFLLYSELTGLSGQGGEWNILTTYGKNNFVKGSDGNFYISLTDGNLGNDPVSVSTSWSEFAWPTIYNPSEVYNNGDTCVASDGDFYQSKTDGVSGQNPVTDLTNWKPPVIPHGSKMLFVQATAPVGWTIDATQNNKALRVVSAAGGATGGTIDFSAAFSSTKLTEDDTHNHAVTVNLHTLTSAQSGLVEHNHVTNINTTAGTAASGSGGVYAAGATTQNVPAQDAAEGHNHTASSADDTHNHTVNLDVKYIDAIICTRD